MTYETSKFGGSSNVTVVSNVSNNYGPRSTGGGKGNIRTAGSMNEAVINFDASGPSHLNHQVPAGAVVVDIRGVDLTGSISAATVGAVDISAAQLDTDTTWVTVPLGGTLTVTGPTAGKVVVKYDNIV